jgi:hypothetical protein
MVPLHAHEHASPIERLRPYGCCDAFTCSQGLRKLAAPFSPMTTYHPKGCQRSAQAHRQCNGSVLKEVVHSQKNGM